MRKKNIFVVEDEHLVAKDIEKFLSAFGYSVNFAITSGYQGFKQVEEAKAKGETTVQVDLGGIFVVK